MFEKTERQVDSLTRTRRPGRGGENAPRGPDDGER